MLLTKAPDKKVNKMQKIAELLEKAGKLASDTGRREGVWARHDTYMVTTSPGDGLRHIKAPTWDKSGAKVRRREYQPLVKYPDLFLRFARLADDGGLDDDPLDSKKNEPAALDWCRRYGALGFTPSDEGGSWGGDPRGGREDSVRAFAFEAWAANSTLRLYEAATNPNGVDVDVIASFVPERRRGFFTSTPEIAAAWAKDRAIASVNRVLGPHSCLQIYVRSADDRAIDAYDFRDLLGAMYLQAMWLLIAGNLGRCRNPECRRVLAFEQPERKPDPSITNDRGMGYKTRSDREYCDNDNKCANRHYYLRETKLRRAAERERLRKGTW
jgi:hypothetical protein